MNIYEFRNYVNLDIDDSYSVIEIALWFNKGIANYNLIPPLTNYRTVAINTTDEDDNDFIDAYEDDVELSDDFMLAIMLPFVTASVKSSEASVEEKQIMMQEFIRNAKEYKLNNPISSNRRVDTENEDLENYKLGENVFLARFDNAPFQAQWSAASTYKQMTPEEEE